ncbi:MAG: hypothetical protein NT166_18880 [Candidatus Aminicenantes bacterium]|nr:hypothetical protein [Candidatus Aminicenantes bacterium]
MKTYRSAKMDKLLREKPGIARLVIGQAIRKRELARKRFRIAIKNMEAKDAVPG